MMLRLEDIGVSHQNGRAIHLGASPLLLEVIERLGIEELINAHCPSGRQKVSYGKAALAIMLSRLLSPKAMYKIEDWLRESGIESLLGCRAEKFNDDLLARMMDVVSEQSEALWIDLIGRAFQAYPELLDRFIHYDVTSTYFEGEYANSLLVKRGYSRDHRSDAKQVNLGVSVLGESNLPLMYELLAGNQADCKTPLSHMARLKALLGKVKHPGQVVVIGDRAMFNRKLIGAYLEQDVLFLGPWTPSEVRGIVAEVGEAELMAQALAFQPQSARPGDPPTYYGVLRKIKFEYQGKTRDLTVLVLYSRGKAKLDRARREDHVRAVEEGLREMVSKLNVRRYRKKCYVQVRIQRLYAASPDARGLVKCQLTGRDGALRLSFERDEKAIQQAAGLDGRYALVTNAELSADEMLKAFKGQCRAEQRFHILKGPLKVRPLHVRSDKRIAALVFLSMVALVIYTILEWLVRRATPDRERPLTGRAILEVFEELTVTACVADNGSVLWLLPIFSLQQATVWQILGLPPLRAWLPRKLTGLPT
jgi:transposase